MGEVVDFNTEEKAEAVAAVTPIETPADTQPKVVAEILLQALSTGNVAMTIPQGLNIWDLRGILAKALYSANGLEVKIT